MIGVFDSGLGGLTILKGFLSKLPDYDYIYLGDSARAPYGNKSQDVIYGYTKEALDFLFKKGCGLVVVACNTASAKALRKVQQEWLLKNHPHKRVLGVIVPVVEAVSEIIDINSKNNRVGIIATRATINSNAYELELKKRNNSLLVYNQHCPLLVPLIEEGWIKRKETKMVLRYYLRFLKKEKVNVLILGCTHYPILYKEIEKIMEPNCKVLNSPEFVATKLGDYLKRHSEIEKKLSKTKKRFFYTTDDPERFKALGKNFLRENIQKVEKINL